MPAKRFGFWVLGFEFKPETRDSKLETGRGL